MKTEKLIIFAIFLGLIQLAACERSKINDPAPSSLRKGADSLGQYPGDSLPLDSIYKPDTLIIGVDSLPFTDSLPFVDSLPYVDPINPDSLNFDSLQIDTLKRRAHFRK